MKIYACEFGSSIRPERVISNPAPPNWCNAQQESICAGTGYCNYWCDRNIESIQKRLDCSGFALLVVSRAYAEKLIEQDKLSEDKGV